MYSQQVDITGAHILLVDDQPANLDVLFELLQPEGYELSMAPNGEMALRIATQGESTPDLILLDVMMPDLDGYEVCRQLRAHERTRDVPVIFVTAEGQPESVVRGFDVGGDDYIAKPFRGEEVLVRSRNALVTKYLLDETRAHREKAEAELRTAHRMQMSLMPTQHPQIEGFGVAGRCIPAGHVCGDFYQYYSRPGGRFAIGLADVTGHAMQAAIPAVLFSGMLETQMESTDELNGLFDRLNHSLHRILDRRTYVCFTMVEIEPSGRLRMRNAACPPALHYREETGDVVEMCGEGSYPLGADVQTRYRTVMMDMAPGDRLVLYSDGIVEASDAEGTILGFEGLAGAVRRGSVAGGSADDLLEMLLSTVATHTGGLGQEDDQTVVVIASELPHAPNHCSHTREESHAA